MEYFDICDKYGRPTGKVVSRADAHKEGILHRTAHVWIVRKSPKGYDILLQKRSMDKDSFPGFYDTSSAGHIPAGDEPLDSALRELFEELGIKGEKEDLAFAGTFHIEFEAVFHGEPFRNNEFTFVYVYKKNVDEKDFTLQESEVDEVKWFDMDEVWNGGKLDRNRFCVPTEGLRILRSYLQRTNP